MRAAASSGLFALNREITRTSNQTIISRQLWALSTPARLAESPEWSETAVSTQEDRASSAAATTPPVNQCGEPWFTRVSAITVWLEVRVLPAPPRSLAQTEISRLLRIQEGHYRVRIEGQWLVVPDAAVVTEPNRFGPAVVWPYTDRYGNTRIRCFIPGAGT